jgi:glucose/arabinose dehydrogenase
VQSLDALEGKILRIPLAALREAMAPLGFKRSWVIACGVRDTHGMGIAKLQGKAVLVMTDHGPTGQGPQVPKELAHETGLVARDEINVIELNATGVVNLGWPLISALDEIKLGKSGDCPRQAQAPRHVWGPDGTQEGVAPSGLAIFQASDPSHPWNGHVFVATLKGKSIRQLFMDRTGAILGEAIRFPHPHEEKKDAKRKRAIACNAKGDCFFGTSEGDKSSGCITCRDDEIVRFTLRRP